MFWWLFNMLFRGFRKEAGWMTSISSLAACTKGWTGCRTDTVVCLMTFGCPLRPVHRESKATLLSHSSNSQISLYTEKQDNSKYPFSDRSGTKRGGKSWIWISNLWNHIQVQSIFNKYLPLQGRHCWRCQGYSSEERSQKLCPHGVYILVKVAPCTVLGKIFNFLSFISSFNKSLLLPPCQAMGIDWSTNDTCYLHSQA